MTITTDVIGREYSNNFRRLASLIASKSSFFRSKGRCRFIGHLLICVVLGLLYYFIDNVTIQELIPSFLLSVIAYDYYFKAVLKKLKVGYKHDE